MRTRNIVFLQKAAWIVPVLLTLFGFTADNSKAGRKRVAIEPDSLCSSDYIKSLVSYQKEYDFINYKQNYMEWFDSEDAFWFFDKLQQTPNRKLKVLHIGDSHVQADIFTGKLRQDLQAIFGYGGRGMIFPFATAQTHSAFDYRSFKRGIWDYAKNVHREPKYDLGVTGVTAMTFDTAASFKFIFAQGSMKPNFTNLRLYCRKDSASFDIKVKYSNNPNDKPILVNCNKVDGKSYVEFKLPKITDTLEFFIEKTEANQKYFECHGISIESNEQKGVVYNSVGINGAGLKSILRQNLFYKQLSEMKPDLVVVDLGGNDFYPRAINNAEMELNYTRIIDSIRANLPEASIMIANTQDCYWRKKNIVECQYFADLTRRVAMQKKCLLYDYYRTSGGRHSMLKWSDNALAQKDRTHLRTSGYTLKGELYVNAFLNSYQAYLRDNNDSLVINKNFVDTTFSPQFEELKAKEEVIAKNNAAVDGKTASYSSKTINKTAVSKTSTHAGNKIIYRIQEGDNLGYIAEKYRVSIKELMSWNGLKNNKIFQGKTLVIYPKGYVPKTTVTTTTAKTVGTNKSVNLVNNAPTKTNTATKLNTQAAGSKTTTGQFKHTVKNGENLWVIAKKHNVTVADIRKWNSLKSDKLDIGDVLIIKK